MDIGTGKDIEEYTIEGVQIPYHLIDIQNPGDKYNIAAYQYDFINAYNKIRKQEKIPILCGGSGLYIETALKGNSFLGIPSDEELWVRLKQISDEELELLYDQIELRVKKVLNAKTTQRKIRAIEIAQFLKKNPAWKPTEVPSLKPLIVGIDIERDLRREKITKRLSQRLNNGLIQEVEYLLANFLSHDDLDYYGLEYKWIGRFIRKEITKKELFEQLNIAIHQFSKRQMTWFRKMEKNGYVIHWLDVQMEIHEKIKHVERLFFRE